LRNGLSPALDAGSLLLLLAGVPGELDGEKLLGLGDLFQQSDGDTELALAESADGDGWGGADPTGDAEPGFCHDAVSHGSGEGSTGRKKSLANGKGNHQGHKGKSHRNI